MLYQIRNKTTGQYSKGSLPSPLGTINFSKYGKVWASKQALHAHIGLVENGSKWYGNGNVCGVYSDCEVIVIDVDKKTVDVMDFDVYYEGMKQKK